MKIKGAFPVRWAAQDGQPGTGVTIVQTTTRYAKSTSGTTRPTSGWQTSVPDVPDGQYLWTWVYVRYSDGTETNAYSVARMGIDGRGILRSSVTYSQQATSVDPTTITNWGAFPSTLTDGYWLYTKTHIVYSDKESTDSYSVSQVGVGSYYAGCQEYWAKGSSDVTPPEGAPTTGTYVNGQTIPISGTWSQNRVQTTTDEPYLWNFEVSADSRGNRYVTQAICIGNFAKGIVSIVESYAISAHGSAESGRSYPSDIAAGDWKDEQNAAAPTEAKRYQWNRTVVTYNDDSTDTHYHVSAVKGTDGKGAVYIDLDNENDSMLYDGQGTLVSREVTSSIALYDNGAKVASPPTFSIKEKSSSVTASIDKDSNNLPIVKVSGITSNAGYVIVQCTYNGVNYTARMTIKRLVGIDKYEIVLNHTAVTYNETKGTLSNASITLNIYRTAQNGTRKRVANTTALNTLKLTAKVYPNGVATNAEEITFSSSAVGTISLTAAKAAEWTNFAVVLFKNNVEIDRETIPINKVEDGAEGHGAIILDLDNENDAMLYDGAGNLKSGNVTSQGKLLDAGEDKTSDVSTWALRSLMNVTGTISASGRITITGVSADSGSAIAVATYGGKEYTAQITIKKLVGVDKFEIICTPNALTYNSTKGENPQQSILVEVYRTAQNGSRTLVENLADYGLSLYYYWKKAEEDWLGPTGVNDGSGSGQYYNGVKRTLRADLWDVYRYDLRNSGGLVLDSESVAIGKNSDGVGTPGASAKSVYKNSFSEPGKPTGATPQGWTDEPDEQTELAVQPQGDWYLTEDGYLTAPLIGSVQTSIETLSFVTTKQNQTLNFRLRCSTSPYDKVYIGKVDAVAPISNYLRLVSGTSQDTGDLAVMIETPGTHFICVAFVRGNSGSTTYVKFVCGNMFVWQSNAVTYNTDGSVATWSKPFKVSGKDAAFTTATKTNLLLQTNFIASRMDKWNAANGATTEGLEGRNGYHGTANYESDLKELLRQTMYDPSGEKRLLSDTWYTLSFWAKAAPYIHIDKYITSIAYGFGQTICYFAAGVQNTLTINGYVSSAAASAGKSLRVFIYADGWTWSTSVAVTNTYSTSASVTFEVPTTGKYFITAYVYAEPGGGNSAVSGHTATLNWLRVNRGMMMITYLYPAVEGVNETQEDWTCIDVTAGRIKDGELMIGGSPTDNNATWQLTEAWTRHTLTFKTRNIPAKAQNFLIRMAQHSNDVYVCMVKIEQGTVATDYCTNDSDIADFAADETGFPNDRNIWVESPDEPYIWNEERRDYVAYEINGEWKRYFVKSKGMTVPNGVAPSAGGNRYWSEGSRINTLLVNTIVGANASLTFATSNRLLIRNSAGSVSLGMGGVDSDYDYPLWIGATYANRANAPFKVNLLGHLYSTRGFIGSWVIKEQQLISQLGTISGSESTDYDNASFIPHIALDSVNGEIRAGNTMKLTSNGLLLFNGTKMCAKIVNQAISTEMNPGPTSGSGTLSLTQTHTIYIPTADRFEGSETWQTSFGFGYLYNGATIRLRNATFSLTLPSVSSGVLSYDSTVTVRVRLSDGTIVHTQKVSLSGMNINATLTFDKNYTIDGSTHPESLYHVYYEILVKFVSVGQVGTTNSATMRVTNAEYTFNNTIEKLLLVGNNGLFNRQAENVYIKSTNNGFQARYGNYILEVGGNGIRKSANGGSTWVTL